jgi:hypothetical protein
MTNDIPKIRKIEGIKNYVKGKWIITADGNRFYAAKSPIEKGFFNWIRQHPESRNPADMERFYKFTKAFCQYKRKNKNSFWLRDKINSDLYKGHNLSEEQIERYCTLFDDLINFYNIL